MSCGRIEIVEVDGFPVARVHGEPGSGTSTWQGWLEAGQVRHAAERARFLAAAAADVELVDRWMGDGMPWTRYVPAAPAWIAA